MNWNYSEMKNKIAWVRKFVDDNGIHFDMTYKNGHWVSYYWDAPQFILDYVREAKEQRAQYFNGRHETFYFAEPSMIGK